MATEIGDLVNQAPAGWYPDAGNPDRERLWTGERWLNWVRPLKAGRTEDTPVGWYDDSGHPGFQRLWSGEMWTEEIRRAPVVAAAPPLAPAAPAVVAAQTPVPPSFHPNQWSLQAEQPGPSMTYHDTRAPDRLRGLGNWVRIGLGACAAASVWQLVANQRYINVEKKIIGGEAPSLTNVRSASHVVHASHSVTLVFELITAIVFIIWFYRAYCNLVRVGISDLRFGPGWSIGGWFVPIFNLFRQKQIANDIWKASASAGTVGLARRGEVRLPWTLNWWWAAWIVSSILTGIGGARISGANAGPTYSLTSLHHEETGLWWNQAGLVVAIAAAILAIVFVGAVSRLQDESFGA
jgi:hypothetical protein